MLNQKTVYKDVSIDGVGLHSGKQVNMRILPALPNSGIQFKRIDIPKNNIIIPVTTDKPKTNELGFLIVNILVFIFLLAP